MFCIFEWLLLKTYLIKFLNSPYSSRPYGRLLENQKTEGSRELFPPENDFQNSSTKIFQKKHSDFEGPEKPTEDMKFRLEFLLHRYLIYMNSI